jgi:hypothetical protein
MRYARYDCAVFCIHVPVTEMNCPVRNSTKSREASAGKRWLNETRILCIIYLAGSTNSGASFAGLLTIVLTGYAFIMSAGKGLSNGFN